MSNVVYSAIKYRLYPTKKQQEIFAKSFGCCRKIWNLMLADKKAYYEEHQKMLQTTPAQYKDEYPYLREVDSLALANVQMQLQQAFKNALSNKKFGYPKFKSKKRCRKASYTTNCQHNSIELSDQAVKLPKVGWVKAKVHRKPQTTWKLKSATISRTASGKYFVALLFEYEEQIPQVMLSEENAVGLDYKSDGFYCSSDNEVCGSPKYYRKAHKKLAREQRRLSKRVKGSQNYWKQKQKVARVQEHIANQRKDFCHKQSTAIAKSYDIVCVESLNMRSMSNKGFGNGKATLDNGWGMFLLFLEYKLRNRGKALVKVDKWYPSSQICHDCGTIHPELKDLSIREWDCPDCGAHHDRDYNAALNIRDEGLRVLKQTLT